MRAPAFLRSDATINMGGLAIAAVPPLLAIPVLSRVYAPVEFGIYGAAMAVASVASVLMTGRYETAIVVPKSDNEAVALAWSAATIASMLAAIGLICALVISSTASWVSPNVAVAAVCVAYMSALSQVAINAAVRFGSFRSLALGRIMSAFAQAALGIVAGMIGLGAAGLLAAFAIGYALIILIIAFSISRAHLSSIVVTPRDVYSVARAYRKYPLINVPSEISNALASQLPTLFFTAAYGPATTGFLTMFFRVWAGSAIISRGVGEFFRHRASREKHASGQFTSSFRATSIPLICIALLAALILSAGGPSLFALVLGEEWRETGEFARILAPFVATQLVASTMSSSFYVSGHLAPMALWQGALLVIQFIALWIGVSFGAPWFALLCLSMSGIVMYSLYFWLAYRAAGRPSALP